MQFNGLFVPPANILPTIGLFTPPSRALNVRDYGALGDGTTDDTAAIQNALNAVPVAGADLYFPTGTYLVPAGSLTCARPVHLIGAGGHGLEAGGARIQVTSATAQCITLSGPRWHMTDLVIENTGTGTPSAGGGLLAVDADYTRITRCMFIGFYNNVQMGGFYWSITDSAFFNSVNYGLYLLAQSGEYDNGDQIIKGCVFSKIGDGTKGSANGGDAVRWESGGGLKFIGNKINGGTLQVGYPSAGKFDGGIRCYAADGISTSGITINDNNIENCTTIGVEVKLSGGANTGVLSKITVNGNSIGINGSGISISPQATAKISVVSIAGNVMTNVSAGIFLQNVRGVAIGRNIHNTVTTPVSMAATCTDIQCDPQLQVQDNSNIIADASYQSNGRGAGLMTFRDDRDIPSTTSTVTFTRLWTITTPLNSGGIITLKLGGFVTGQAAFAVLATRSWTRAGAGATVCTAIGTDLFVGTLVDITFDTATSPGFVQIGVKLNVAGGTDVFGRASLSIEGPTGTLKKGT